MATTEPVQPSFSATAPSSSAQVHTVTTRDGDTATLSYAPLDPAAIEQSCRSEKDGAVVSFVGYTRDNFQGTWGGALTIRATEENGLTPNFGLLRLRTLANLGRTVTHLTYESYVPLALKTLELLLTEAHDLLPPPPAPFADPHSHACCSPSTSATDGRIEISRIHVAHLLGPSPPLTPSIVISVASPHRREAFYVCEWMLEMVKRRVQVWKREWYKEGEFVGRDGEGPYGFGGRAGEGRWKENFPQDARNAEVSR
ncbi:polyA+ RNA export protein [Rhodotorula toruloides]|uniref:PolyA+ RNA export protein n=1 Tax=Rhodotorula toruloides TaxID=5286 RepID=A0A511KNY8_RHOTO|nr:polyA+ RNA export protein [Rhodotorula toruloides]